MFAKISKEGVLIVTPVDSTEEYALNKLGDELRSDSTKRICISLDGKGILTVEFNRDKKDK